MKYAGEWKNAKAHGIGTLTNAEGFKYVGEWQNEKFNGKGEIELR